MFRSPDSRELCCIMRENMRTGTSLLMFSPDEGATWSAPVPTPWGLTGDRHQGVQLPDGRLVIVFRNGAPGSEDRFVACVGTYDDIKHGRSGQYTVALLNGFSDGGYPGIHLLPDGTIVATTYASLATQENPSIVSIRFTIAEVDALAGKRAPQRVEAIDVEPVWAGHRVAFDLRTQVQADCGTAADGLHYALASETLPANRDRPRDPPPPPSMLGVIETATDAGGTATNDRDHANIHPE